MGKEIPRKGPGSRSRDPESWQEPRPQRIRELPCMRLRIIMGGGWSAPEKKGERRMEAGEPGNDASYYVG